MVQSSEATMHIPSAQGAMLSNTSICIFIVFWSTEGGDT
jgi:hypothetical protein